MRTHYFYFFLLSIALLSCKDKQSELPKPSSTTTEPSKPTEKYAHLKAYFYGILDNKDTLIYDNVNDFQNVIFGGYPETINDGEVKKVIFKQLYFNPKICKPILEIKKGTLITSTDGVYEQTFFDFIKVGKYPYSVNAENGIEINWYDPSGEKWSTSFGPENESCFFITKAEKSVFEYVKTDYHGDVELRIDCYLYNQKGDRKILHGRSTGFFEEVK